MKEVGRDRDNVADCGSGWRGTGVQEYKMVSSQAEYSLRRVSIVLECVLQIDSRQSMLWYVVYFPDWALWSRARETGEGECSSHQ